MNADTLRPHPFRSDGVARQYNCLDCGYKRDNEIHDDPREGDWQSVPNASKMPHPFDGYTQPPLLGVCRLCLHSELNGIHDVDKAVPNINAERAAMGLPPYEPSDDDTPSPAPARRRFAPRSSTVRPINAMRYLRDMTTADELRAFDERIDVVTSSNTGVIFFIYVNGHPVERGDWIVRTPGTHPSLPHSGSTLTILTGHAFHALFTELDK